MVGSNITTVGLEVGRGTKPYFVCPGERGKLEILMAAPDWSDGLLSLESYRERVVPPLFTVFFFFSQQ